MFQGCKAQPADKITGNKDENTLLWEITGNGIAEPSYLFGTFHLMCKEDIKFSEQLKTAMKNSKEIYFEMDLDDPSNTLGAIFFMNMKGGKSLKDLYTETEYKRLMKFFEDSVDMPLTMLQKMKPNFIEALVYPKMMPCKTFSGVEEELMQMAKVQKKEIQGFETIAFQASVFDSIPYEDQAKELLGMIDSLQENREKFDSMLAIYKAQQLPAMEEMFNKEEFGIGASRDLLLDSRNKNWVQQMKKIFPSKNVFIAVGAGHLVGENGLISLLRKSGYTLRPLLNK